jgi:hypothetical protein
MSESLGLHPWEGAVGRQYLLSSSGSSSLRLIPSATALNLESLKAACSKDGSLSAAMSLKLPAGLDARAFTMLWAAEQELTEQVRRSLRLRHASGVLSQQMSGEGRRPGSKSSRLCGAAWAAAKLTLRATCRGLLSGSWKR